MRDPLIDEEHVIWAIVIVVALICMVAVYDGWRDCERRGGAYVRAAFLYECVAKAPEINQ